jgi:D-hexose-6-phosphate mutarotase
VDNFTRKTETADAIIVTGETDRVYLDTTTEVEILDPGYRRRVMVAKSGSASTVVWNPWIAKAQQMADFGNDEYRRMICVESGNVAGNRLTLAPGETSTLSVTIRSAPL